MLMLTRRKVPRQASHADSDIGQSLVVGRSVADKLYASRIALANDRTAYGQWLTKEFETSIKAARGNIFR